MTPAQQTKVRIAIAEWRGLNRLAPIERRTRTGKRDKDGVVLWFLEESHGGADTWARVPDVCNDLNACHEAEKGLTPDQHRWFCNNLRAATSNDEAISATALQRAEALYRTIKGEAP